MINYYIEKENKIIFFDTDLERLQNTIINGEYSELEIQETERPIVNFQFADTPEYISEQEAKAKEQLRAQLQSQIHELDIKRIRAISEPSDKEEGLSWLDYYTQQIQELREQIGGL